MPLPKRRPSNEAKLSNEATISNAGRPRGSPPSPGALREGPESRKERTQSNIYLISKGNCRCPNKVGLSTLSPARAQRGTSPTPVARYRKRSFSPAGGTQRPARSRSGVDHQRSDRRLLKHEDFFFSLLVFYFLEIAITRKRNANRVGRRTRPSRQRTI